MPGPFSLRHIGEYSVNSSDIDSADYITPRLHAALLRSGGLSFRFELIHHLLYFELGAEGDCRPVNLNEPYGFGLEEGKHKEYSSPE